MLQSLQRPSLLITALLLLSVGCSEIADPDQPAPTFPVRQFESGGSRPTDGRLVLDDGFDDLDDWWLLSVNPKTGFSLVPAAGAPGINPQGGHVVLEADTALVRHVALTERARYTLTALLWGPPAPAKSPCPNLILASTRGAKAAAFEQGAFTDPNAAVSLATMFLELVQAPTATWRTDAGAGFTEARSYTHVDIPASGSQGMLVVIAAWGTPLVVDNVALLSTPILRHGYDPSTELPSQSEEIAITGLKISGQYRISARVPPGRTLSMPINVPEGALDIALGTCPDPDPTVPPGTPTSWTLRLQPGDHVLGQFSEQTPPQGKLPHFEDRVLPWPHDMQGPVTLEFEVTGNAAMVFGAPKVRGPENPDSPSLLFISIDTLRADHLGLYGYERPTSPFLDSYAKRAAVFEDAMAVASYTLPTHASMFTGLFPPRHLAIDTLDRVDAERTPTLGRILSDAGFHTAGFTGGGFVSVDYGFAAGFDRYTTVDPIVVPVILAPDDQGQYPDRDRIKQASQASGMGDIQRWIRRQGDRKWMAFVHTFAVHEYNPPPQDEALFAQPRDLPPDFDVQKCLNTSHAVTNPPTEAMIGRLIDLYDATIHEVDRRLGRLLGELEGEGLLDNTIVVITSDHGEEFFDHGNFRHRGTLYQDLIHVPLIIRMPGAPEGLRIQQPVSQVDLLPTLLELLGQPVPEGLDGRSIADYIRGSEPASQPTPLFGHIDRYLHGRTALRDGPLKIIHSDTTDAREEPAEIEWELFDLDADPDERRNLATEREADLALLRRRLEDFQASLKVGDAQRQTIELGDELRNQLIELGYVEAAR